MEPRGSAAFPRNGPVYVLCSEPVRAEAVALHFVSPALEDHLQFSNPQILFECISCWPKPNKTSHVISFMGFMAIIIVGIIIPKSK